MVDQAAVELIKVEGVAGEIPIVPDCAGQGPETVGSVHHVLAGVTFAPPDWTIGPDPVCAAVSANTIGVLTTDDGAIPSRGAVEVGVTNCPAGKTGSTVRPAKAASVSIDCAIASEVALPLDTFLKTAGAQKVLGGPSDLFYVVGRGQAIEVAAGNYSVALHVLRTSPEPASGAEQYRHPDLERARSVAIVHPSRVGDRRVRVPWRRDPGATVRGWS